MSEIFNDCSNLISLPDIHLINSHNITNMSSMFSNCCNLSSLPDISNWYTNNGTTRMICFLIYQIFLSGILIMSSKWMECF